jgi:transcriptional/translational regulatory protein YebC/TACO1
VINNEDEELDEDTVMMDALEAGAADFEADGPVFEVTTDPDSFNDVVAALETKGYTFVSADIEMVPQNYVTITDPDDVRSMEKLLDMLEDNEDVQNVWHNWQND